MTAAVPLLILLSVLLSAGAQLLLKLGMSDARVQAALAAGAAGDVLRAVALNPVVVAGLGVFGLSALVWLLVLSRVDVSYAYPCVALGIVITVIGGHVLFGEPVPPLRMLGLGVIVAGVALVAAAR